MGDHVRSTFWLATSAVALLLAVIAAGYPGITISNDADYRAFAQGNRNAQEKLAALP